MEKLVESKYLKQVIQTGIYEAKKYDEDLIETGHRLIIIRRTWKSGSNDCKTKEGDADVNVKLVIKQVFIVNIICNQLVSEINRLIKD